MKIHFEVPISPQSQKRGRSVHANGHTWTHKNPQQAIYESKLSVLMSQYKPEKPLEGAIGLYITCCLPIPASKPKKWKIQALNCEIQPTGKPDADNMFKNITDVMEGVFYRNDSQITELSVSKIYSDNPRWIVELTEIS